MTTKNDADAIIFDIVEAVDGDIECTTTRDELGNTVLTADCYRVEIGTDDGGDGDFWIVWSYYSDNEEGGWDFDSSRGCAVDGDTVANVAASLQRWLAA